MSTPTAVAGFLVDECERDQTRIAIPRPEVHLVVRFGPQARHGLDVHALGVRQQAYRKLIRGGQRTVFARLPLSSYEAALGTPAADIAGRIVALEDLWGDAATKRLLGRLADAHDADAAAAVLESAVAERVALACRPSVDTAMAGYAAEMLQSASVTAVARELGLSERHFRRVFHRAAGISPKAFAKLARFHRALRAASEGNPTAWSSIAAAAGYYDQAHLIADFHAIAGTTPRALLAELHAGTAQAAQP
jgi:AraC-like DNA-binding protein